MAGCRLRRPSAAADARCTCGRALLLMPHIRFPFREAIMVTLAAPQLIWKDAAPQLIWKDAGGHMRQEDNMCIICTMLQEDNMLHLLQEKQTLLLQLLISY